MIRHAIKTDYSCTTQHYFSFTNAKAKRYDINMIYNTKFFSQKYINLVSVLQAVQLAWFSHCVCVNLCLPAMVELDGDDIRISSRGKLAERDIVQVTALYSMKETWTTFTPDIEIRNTERIVGSNFTEFKGLTWKSRPHPSTDTIWI